MKPTGFARQRKGLLALSAITTATVAALSGAPAAQAAASPIDAGVVSLTQLSETRVSRTVYDYVYRVTVKNGTQPQTAVIAKLTAAGTGTTILDGTSAVGDMVANATSTPTDTITLRHDRTYAFNPGALVWQVDGNLTNAPAAIKMVWLGIANWHYQIGNTGILLDGEVRNASLQQAAVTKALNALQRAGTVDAILLGHVHPDHSQQLPGWAAQTGKRVYAPAGECTALVNAGLPASQCTSLVGGEVIPLDDFTTVRAVRWVHSLDCGEFGNGTNTPETFGFLVTARSNERGKMLNFYVSDSGAGGIDLITPRRVGTTVYGTPINNLKAAMADAGLKQLAIWQGGPESRMVHQAKVVVPTFHVQTFMPHHLNARANAQSSFSLTYGMHYAYGLDDQPLLNAFLQSQGVPQVYPTNYLDAWVYTNSGITKIANTAMKADYGLPADGPGPGVQGPNPRLGQLECVGDGDPLIPMPPPI